MVVNRKHRNFIGLVAILIIISFFFMQGATASVGTLQIYSGSAEVIRNSQSSQATSGSGIRLNDKLKIAPQSRTAMVLKDGSVVRFESGSEIEISDIQYQGNKLKQARFKLLIGRLWSRVEPLDPNSRFEVETPTIVAAVAGTSFNTTYLPAETGIYTDRDRVKVALKTDLTASKTVNAGELLKMANAQLDTDFALGAHSAPADFFDDWIRFNQAEDAKLDLSTPIPSPSQMISATILPTQSPTNLPTATPVPSTPIIKIVPTKTPLPKTPLPKITARPTTQATTTPAPTKSPTPKPTPIPTPTPMPHKTTQQVTLSANRTTLNVGESATLTAMAMYSDNSTENVTSKVTWPAGNEVGTYRGNTFNAIAPGTAWVEISFDHVKSNRVTFTVVQTAI